MDTEGKTLMQVHGEFLMRHWMKISIFLITISCLILIVGLWGCSGWRASDEDGQLIQGIDDQELRKILIELGAIRLRVIPENILRSEMLRSTDFGIFNRPDEFVISDHRRRLRESGFEPVWKNDRYVLRDMESGKELDPFRLRPEKGLKTKKIINENSYVQELISETDWAGHMPHDLRARMYYYQMSGFRLVLRRPLFLADRFLYVKDVRKSDLGIELDELILLDEAVTFNGCIMGMERGIEECEIRLRDRGFIMKKKGDSYVPVSLETGVKPGLPPEEIFVRNALETINKNAQEDYLAEEYVPFGGLSRSWFEGHGRTPHFEKVLLDIYGVEIQWSKSKRRYEVVE